MENIIAYIKEKQKEYTHESSGYKVLRHLEVTLPSLFPPSPVEGEKEELPDVIKFLLGESSFKSCWFGSESIPFGEKGRYWWRKHLRKYTEAQASRIKALEEQVSMIPLRKREVIKEVLELRGKVKALEERLEKVTKIINHELAEIPKLQDFASKHGDAQGYARICGQEIILETLKQKFDKLKH